uniref:zincin-like metallopeptidase domain-containing protein n=1 Tax=Acetatifactor sp. TaxID=1872090 RepID=UPI0040572E05
MNVYEIITEKIIERINEAKDSGKPFHWVRPWSGGPSFSVSYTTQQPYRGINRLILDAGEYITFNALQDYRKTQSEDATIFVKRGARKQPVFYYGKYDKKDENGNPILDEFGNQEQGSFLRFYQVFNIEDIKGIHSHFPAIKTAKTSSKQTKLLDKYIAAYVEATNLDMDIVEDGANCFYDAANHRVRVPAKEGFISTYAYYSAILHELIHSTSKGLNRSLGKSFGSDAYSREELIAQIGSQIMLTHFQIAYDDKEFENDIAYIDGWSSKLKKNVQEIAKAAAQAEKAMQYFLDTAEEHMRKCKKKTA